MKTIKAIFAVLIAIVFVAGMAAAENKYVGVKMCGACHKSGKGGTAYAVWEKSAHAKAYQTLLSEVSKQLAKGKGIKTPPHESPECLKCHVTGGGTAKNIEATFKKEEGVTCEACHGASSAFKMMHSKGDLAKSKEAGLDPGQKDAKFCTKCHNSESPTHTTTFKLDEMWAKIAHSGPPKK